MPSRHEVLNMSERIDAMAASDRRTSILFTIAMWAVLTFTFFSVVRLVPNLGVALALAAALIVLGGFNTVSMIAMIQGFSKNKTFIYEQDILHLDRNLAQKRQGDPIVTVTETA